MVVAGLAFDSSSASLVTMALTNVPIIESGILSNNEMILLHWIFFSTTVLMSETANLFGLIYNRIYDGFRQFWVTN